MTNKNAKCIVAIVIERSPPQAGDEAIPAAWGEIASSALGGLAMTILMSLIFLCHSRASENPGMLDLKDTAPLDSCLRRNDKWAYVVWNFDIGIYLVRLRRIRY